MIGRVLILGLFLVGADGPRNPAQPGNAEGAVDRITLRDGSVVLGVVTAATSGPRGAVEFLVRREWAEKHLKDQLARWDRSSSAAVQRAALQRQQRLSAWRRERAAAPDVGPDDKIVQWIDREANRLANPQDLSQTPLVGVRLPRGEVRELDRRPAAVSRLLRLAYLSELPEPEAMSVDELKDALEARGYSADAAAKASPVALDRLLPPAPENDAVWQARRAATELAIDAGLRFLRFQDAVLPEPRPGEQPVNALNLTSAVSELKRLLDPDAGQDRPDPLIEKLQAVAARGRIGAVVTRLAIATDMSGVTVETTLWARGGSGRWGTLGSRTATVRSDELKPEAGRDIGEDPQVQGAFRMVEMLGLGGIPQELKDRSLRIGAATQKALETARTALNLDLDSLTLPVLDTVRDVEARKSAPKAQSEPAGNPAPRRRSVLGPS